MTTHHLPTLCPTCFQALPEAHYNVPQVSLVNNTVAWRSRIVEVTPTHAEFLYALLNAHPIGKTRKQLLAALYGAFVPEKYSNIVSVYASQINRKFTEAELSVWIEGPGVGRRNQPYKLRWKGTDR